MNDAIALTPIDLVVATLLVLFTALSSFLLRIDAERRLLIAAVRTVVQLLLVGYVLRWVFHLDDPLLVLGVLVLMIAVAGRSAVDRSPRAVAGMFFGAFATLALTATATTFFVTTLIIGVEPWYRPQYLIPLVGMVLGNGLSGVSLSLDTLLESLDAQRADIEVDLAFGATRWEAVRRPLAEAIRRGMMPIINAMSVAGVVSLPGMMTGQILQGADPLEAVKYQIVIMFMVAAATTLSCIGVAVFVFVRCFNDRHQLRTERIRRRASRRR